jgi:hypothetical protein
MKKILVLILLFVNAFANAQNNSSDPFPRPSVEIGTGIQFSHFNGSILDKYYGYKFPVNQLSVLYTLAVSVNIPLKKLKEEFYFGLNPNATFGYSYGNFEAGSPVFATLKYGAASSENSQSRFGFGFGGGGYVSGLWSILQDQYGGTTSYSTFFVAPVVMGEFSFNTNNGIYQIRTDFTPVSFQKIGNYTGKIGQFNIRLVRSF